MESTPLGKCRLCQCCCLSGAACWGCKLHLEPASADSVGSSLSVGLSILSAEVYAPPSVARLTLRFEMKGLVWLIYRCCETSFERLSYRWERCLARVGEGFVDLRSILVGFISLWLWRSMCLLARVVCVFGSSFQLSSTSFG